MGNKPLNTEFLDRAIVFAVRAHAGTERRGKGFPYVVHPLEAMAIAATMTSDQEILAAAALHDVVEDTEVTLEEIRTLFGGRVASLVQVESDRTEDGLDWRERKLDSLRRLSASSRDASGVLSSREGSSSLFAGFTLPISRIDCSVSFRLLFTSRSASRIGSMASFSGF